MHSIDTYCMGSRFKTVLTFKSSLKSIENIDIKPSNRGMKHSSQILVLHKDTELQMITEN